MPAIERVIPLVGQLPTSIRDALVRRLRELTGLGFKVMSSQTNFILARPPVASAEQWLQKLRQRRILVRWFNQPAIRDYLRITIGTPEEAKALVRAVKAELKVAARSAVGG